MKPIQRPSVWLAILAIALTLAGPGKALAQTRPMGTDVSSFQGSGINWTTVKNDGVFFAWAKAAEGTASDGYIGEDADFTINEADAKAAGVLLGAYYFARPSADPNITGSRSADSEAQFFWSVAGNYVKAGGTNLVPMLDWEDPYVTNVSSLNVTTMSEWLNEWCNDVSNYAYSAGVVLRPVVYTGSWYSEPGAYPGLNTSVTIWPTWVASYPDCTEVNSNEECGSPTPQTSVPSPAYPWSTWDIWQYGDTNWSGGDSDVFNGTTNQFLETFLVGAVIPPGANLYWDPGSLKGSPGSGGTGNWNNVTSNWWYTGSSDLLWPTGGADAVFAGTAGTVTLADGQDATSLTFDTTGYTITGTSETLILSPPGNIVIPTGASETVACVLGGAAFNLSGGGTLILNNAGNYNNGENITGPNTTFEVPTDHPSGNDGVTMNLYSGGIYEDTDATTGDEFMLPGCALALGTGGGIVNNPNGSLTMSNHITGAGSLTYTGTSYTLSLTDTANSYTGGTIVSGPGTLEATAAGTLGSTLGSLTVNGGTLNLGGASHTVGAVTVTGGTIKTGTLTGSSYSAQSGTISATLAGSKGVTKTTTGTFTLSGANTYTGVNTISGGLLQVSADDNLGAAPGSAVANSLTLNGGISSGLRCTASFTINANRGVTVSSPNGGSIQATTSQTITYGGVITGGGGLGIGSSDTTGYGITILSGANNYTGGTTIAAGTLRLGASGTLPSGTAMTIGADGNTGGGGVLDLNGYNQTIGPLASSTGIGGTGTDTPTVKLSGALTVLETSSSAFSGVISGSGGSLTINGPGELTLNGANTYTGNTTISSGALGLGSSGSINNTAQISIAAGGTFDVSAIPAYTLSGSTTLQADGNSTAATIEGGTTVSLGSQPIVLTYDGSHPALTISQGSLSLNGNAFTINGPVLGGGVYTVVQQASGNISSSGSYTVNGTAIGASGVAAVSVSGGSVVLTITDSTATTLNALSPSTYGQSVTFTAAVSPAPSSGTVQFYTNGVAAGGPVNVSGGTASYTTSELPVGNTSISASYGGTTYYTASSSSTSTQQVNQATLDIAATPQSKMYGTVLTFGLGSTNFSSAGLQNGDTVGSVTLAVSGNGGASNAPVCSYIITPSAATGGTFSSNNYSIVYITNTLTVTLPSNTIPVTITSITLLTNGTVAMSFAGTPGYVYYIEAATNLNPPIAWSVISTNAADTNGNFCFTDLCATNYNGRYYQTAAQ